MDGYLSRSIAKQGFDEGQYQRLTEMRELCVERMEAQVRLLSHFFVCLPALSSSSFHVCLMCASIVPHVCLHLDPWAYSWAYGLDQPPECMPSLFFRCMYASLLMENCRSVAGGRKGRRENVGAPSMGVRASQIMRDRSITLSFILNHFHVLLDLLLVHHFDLPGGGYAQPAQEQG